MKSITINLPASEMPRQWYNLGSELAMQPPVDAAGNPIGPDALAKIFPMNLIEQEMCTDRWIDIPEPILEILYTLAADAAAPRGIIWKSPSRLRPGSITRMKASARPGATSPTPPLRRPGTTNSSALRT